MLGPGIPTPSIRENPSPHVPDNALREPAGHSQVSLGDELTAEKMKACVWLRPEAVAQVEFLEWTAGDRLRHAKSAGLRDDKAPRQVVKELATES